MARINYQTFDLIFTRDGEDAYRATTQGSEGGDEFVRFLLTDAPLAVRAQAARHFDIEDTSGDRPAMPSDPAALLNADSREVGRYLFETLFGGWMIAPLKDAQKAAWKAGAHLRIRLNLTDVPELVNLPWELLYNRHSSLTLNPRTSVVRYQSIAEPQWDEPVTKKPLRVLVVISGAATPGARPLRLEEEWRRITDALLSHAEQGLVEVERLPHATREELDKRLLNPDALPVHILHYIGHGTFDEGTRTGRLVFEPGGGDGAFDLVSGERLATSLSGHPSLRLAVLNTCEGATVSPSDSFAGVAQELLSVGGVPVVVAMRTAVSDDVAVTFAQSFYQWLIVNNLPIDAAVTRARLSMYDLEEKRSDGALPVEWATPVLFMRNHSGYIVDFKGTPRPPAPPSEGRDPVEDAHYRAVLDNLLKGKLVPFMGLDVNLFGRDPVPGWEPADGTLPGYQELVEYLAATSHHPVPFIPALADISQFALLHSADVGTFYDGLNSIFGGVSAPTDLHLFWASVAAKYNALIGTNEANEKDLGRRFLIVSNTYDGLLETAFKRSGLDSFHVVTYIAQDDGEGRFRHTLYTKPPGVLECVPQLPTYVEPPGSYPALTDQRPVILKIPGAISDEGLHFAITEDHFLDLFSRKELTSILPAQLLTKLRLSSHLFIGFNVREWSMRALLYRIWNKHETPRTSWAVVERPTEVELKYWESCGVNVIRSRLADYLEGLREVFGGVMPGV